MKLEIFDEKKVNEEKPVILNLSYDDDKNIVINTESTSIYLNGWYIVGIGKNGELIKHGCIFNDFGFQLNLGTGDIVESTNL